MPWDCRSRLLSPEEALPSLRGRGSADRVTACVDVGAQDRVTACVVARDRGSMHFVTRRSALETVRTRERGSADSLCGKRAWT